MMELVKRLILAVIFIPAIIIIFLNGGYLLISFLLLLILLIGYELREILIIRNIYLPLIVIFLAPLIFLSAVRADLFLYLCSFFISFLLLCFGAVVHNKENTTRIAYGTFFLFYVSTPLAAVYHLRMLEGGAYLLFCLIGLIWLTDSAAYFVGKYFGKKKEIFAASPNKTLEGYIAALLMSAVGAVIFGIFGKLTVIQIAALCISTGIFGQVGDLLESRIKRDAGVKDSSTILPGHGGILDRFDSLILAAPVFYILLKLFEYKLF
jgi:phosphatidate cytidylyltransferase